MRTRRTNEPDGSGAVEGEAETSTQQSPAFAARVQRRALQRRAAQGEGAKQEEAPAPEAAGDASGLPAPVRGKMGQAFGTSFDDVRVHQGGEAAAMGAEAFTQGSDIHFAPGRYDPESQSGQELIGHELAHVVQQRQGRVEATQAKGLNDDLGLESEADALGQRAAAGERVNGPGEVAEGDVAAPPIQRKLFIGKGDGTERIIELEKVEALVAEVIALNDAELMKAAKDADPKDPNAAIREAILVNFRNDRHFANIAGLVSAATERLKLIKNVQGVDWDKGADDIANQHPEHSVFVKAMTGILPDGDIERLWHLVVKGVQKQKALNETNLRDSPNSFYIQLATELESLLAVKKGEKPALWSGGYDVSMYAQNQGFKTLETTAAGKVFDQLKLFKDFSTMGPMWNNISRKFTQSFQGETHSFIRTMDKTSVLFRQELAEASHLEGVSAMKWHVLKGTDLTSLSEIDRSGKPAKGFTFDGYRDAATVMDEDSFRSDKGKIDGEPETAKGRKEKMVNEQATMPALITKLDEFAKKRVVELKIPKSKQPKIDAIVHHYEFRLKNDPALGRDLADLYAEVQSDLAKDLAHLSREKTAMLDEEYRPTPLDGESAEQYA